MRHMFESLGYQSGFFLSQLFSSGRSPGPAPPPPNAAAAALKQAPTRPPASAFSWHPHHHHHHHPMQLPPAAVAQMQQQQQQQQQPAFHHHHHNHLHHPSSSRFAQMDDGMISDSELKWPNGLSFFTALTGRADDAKLLFGGACGGGQFSEDAKAAAASDDAEHSGDPRHQEYLSLESNSSKMRRMESSSKFKRSLTMPARMDMNGDNSASSTPTLSLDHHHHHHHQHQHHHHGGASQGMEYRSSETGIYSDIMETFLE